MAIRITEDGEVIYENNPDVNRRLFPNLNIWGKQIDELAEEIDGKAPEVINTSSGSVASFTDGADDMPLKSCVVSFGPIQEGEGDPSPENVRPISGRTGLSVVRSGKNLLNSGILTPNPANTSLYIGGNGYNTYLKAGTYTISCNFASGIRYSFFYKEEVGASVNVWGTTGSDTSKAFTIAKSGNYMFWFYRSSADGGVSTSGVSNIMLNFGSTATDYEPYKGSTYSVNWETEAGSVYSGTIDVVSGKLTVNSAYIASYNAEVLPSTWISDRDVYAAGTIPTTGAQVVYKLAEPIEYQLEPQETRTLLGVNNIWSDAGDVSVEFPADTKTYIDDLSIKTVEVSGQTPTITAEENTRYICGEVTSLTFTPCETGICDVRFTAASISTVLTLPETVKLPDWFDPALLEANTTYEINVLDGIYGVVMSWA